MIGIIVCTHADFALGIQHSIEMIAGKQENFEALPFDGNMQIDEYGAQIKKAVDDMKEDCIIAVDMAHATPYNAALVAIAYSKHIILSGVSLPMLLELVIGRSQDGATAEKLCEQILNNRNEYIARTVSSDVFQ